MKLRLPPKRAGGWGVLAMGCLGAALLGSVRAVAGEPLSGPARLPRLYPDYSEIVVPPNIAPLNFRIEEPGSRYRVELSSLKGKPLVLSSRDPSIKIPLKPWQTLLRGNAGNPLTCAVSVLNDQGKWVSFGVITNRIALEEIDSTLAYRLLKPLYNAYVNLGIYQRDLQSFRERPILRNQEFGGDCLNCHTFLNRQPESFAFHTRTEKKVHPMVLVRSNQVVRVDKTMGYLAWHPSGRLLAFSANQLSMFCHTIGENRDVFDARSDLAIYRVDSNRVVHPTAIAQPARNENWPAWSPDGRHLYFCSAEALPIEHFRQVHYDLMRVSYDLEQDKWGEPEVLVAARDTGLSAAQPKVSPDGRFVLFCLFAYGNFPVYRAESDLYVLDLKTRERRRLEINSDRAESWHCWSSNSRWVVFSSKRLDGLFARPFFSYVDERGHFHKPFVLPQEDPAFYESYLNTINVPELLQGPVTMREADLAQALLRAGKGLVPEDSARPPASASSTNATEYSQPAQ
jgi:hypothetical protein